MCGSVLEREITMQDLLKIISDPERVKLGNIEDKYLSDTLGRLKGTAAALVFPKSTEEVSAVMKFANDRGLPVTPRGARSALRHRTELHQRRCEAPLPRQLLRKGARHGSASATPDDHRGNREYALRNDDLRRAEKRLQSGGLRAVRTAFCQGAFNSINFFSFF